MEKFSFQGQPTLRMLSNEQIITMHEKALHVLEHTGLYFHSPEVLQLLADHGAIVDFETRIVKFPPNLVNDSIRKVPGAFSLYNRDGRAVAHLDGNNAYFDPGSSGIRFLESDGKTVRETKGTDLVKISQICEAMSNIELMATAVTPYDIPKAIGDCFRVYALLKHSTKPFITGAYSPYGVRTIRELLATAAGGYEELRKKPRAILDICSTAPLRWTGIACQNILDAAKYELPIETISVPLIGVSGPATMAGSILVHTVETLSGIVLAQCVNPGTPMIYGGAPMFFDMHYSTTSLNSIETNLISTAYAQMGKYYGMPTHTYAALSDAKVVDAQAGLETAISGVAANLAGINVISGPGMLEFCNTFSLEKLVIDNEICGMIKRLVKGVDFDDEHLAVDLIEELGPSGDYLSSEHTYEWFKKEPYLPSKVIDRMNRDNWHEKGGKDSYVHAREIVEDLLQNPRTPVLAPQMSKALDDTWRQIAVDNGLGEDSFLAGSFV